MNTILNKTIGLPWLISVMTLSVSASVAAQSNNPPAASDQQRREPPPQAYADCKGKQAGDVVQIVTPRDGNISATCTSSPKGLFARPEHPPCDQSNTDKSQKK